MPAQDAGMVGSPSQALRKGNRLGANSPPDELLQRGSGAGYLRNHPSAARLKPLRVDSLGFDPRQKKDRVDMGQKEAQDVIYQRGTALAKQQCLTINLVNLLSQVINSVSPSCQVEPLPPIEEIFRQSDDAILHLLQSTFNKIHETWIIEDRHTRLPNLQQLFEVASERPLMSRRGLRSVYNYTKSTRPWFPTVDLGTGGESLLELFQAAEGGMYNGLARLQPHVQAHLGLNDLPVVSSPKGMVSVESARQAMLAGEATEEDKRVLREQVLSTDTEESGNQLTVEMSPRLTKQRRKSSGHFFTWGDCTVPKFDQGDDAADDVLMHDLAGAEEEKLANKKKVYGGRKRRLSVSINDEIEPTPIIDEKGVFHFGDFAVDTTGGYDYSTYGSSSTGKAAMDFAFGDFAIGVDEETVRKHEPQKLQQKKNEMLLKIPQKEPRPGGLTIVNYKIHNLIGHTARVKCVAISPDERHILSCSHEDVIVVLSDIETGREMVSFSGHDDTLTSVAFSADQKHVATTSRDQNLILWDAITAKVLLQFEHEKVVICCAWSKSGRLIVSGCQDKVCRVWDTKKGKERAAFTEHTAIIISLDFAPDDKHVVSASADKTVRIWTASSGQSIKVLKGHSGIVLGCRYLPDGKQILSNDENEIKLWDVKTGACKLSMHVENIQMALPITRTKKRFTWTLCSACPGDFGNYIIASCNLRTVIIFDRSTGEEVLTFYTRAPVYCLASSVHDKVVLGDSLGNLYVITLQGI